MPVSIVHKTSANNKGSSSKYGFYLNKENKEHIKNKESEKQQFFFNQNEDKISTIKAIDLIDSNSKNKGLRKKQDRYFTVTLNFSDKELKHIGKIASGRKINNINELNLKEYKKYNKLLKEYTKESMKNYTQNFNRGITDKDIVWHAKVEHQRNYKGFDNDVLSGKAKSGELKTGLNSHVHITVSRMHKDYRLSLSPNTNARSNKNLVLNGKSRPGGFDRTKFKQLNEDTFDEKFNYERPLEEKFETNRVLKLGTFEEKREMKSQIQNKKENENEKFKNQVEY